MYEDPDFAIDKESETYKAVKPTEANYESDDDKEEVINNDQFMNGFEFVSLNWGVINYHDEVLDSKQGELYACAIHEESNTAEYNSSEYHY